LIDDDWVFSSADVHRQESIGAVRVLDSVEQKTSSVKLQNYRLKPLDGERVSGSRVHSSGSLV